jgi:PKD repeat protein
VQSSSKPAINETILFLDESTDMDGSIESWFWDFGDGIASTAKDPTHHYESMGTYTITLTVKDDDGATDIQTRKITIYEIYPPETTANYDGLWHNFDFTISYR